MSEQAETSCNDAMNYVASLEFRFASPAELPIPYLGALS